MLTRGLSKSGLNWREGGGGGGGWGGGGGGGGGGVQYDILEILNFVGVYSNNWDKHY
jgi:hypothetical protein